MALSIEKNYILEAIEKAKDARAAAAGALLACFGYAQTGDDIQVAMNRHFDKIVKMLEELLEVAKNAEPGFVHTSVHHTEVEELCAILDKAGIPHSSVSDPTAPGLDQPEGYDPSVDYRQLAENINRLTEEGHHEQVRDILRAHGGRMALYACMAYQDNIKSKMN